MTKFYTRSKGKPMSNLHIFGTLAAAGSGGGGPALPFPYYYPLLSLRADTGSAGDWTTFNGNLYQNAVDTTFWVPSKSNDRARHYQTFDIGASRESVVDAGNARIDLSHYMYTFDGDSDDCFAFVEFYDAGMAFLGHHHTATLNSAVAQAISANNIPVPPGTRTLRVGWQGARVTGSELSAYVRDLSCGIKEETASPWLDAAVAFAEFSANLTGWTVTLSNFSVWTYSLGNEWKWQDVDCYTGGPSNANSRAYRPITIPSGWDTKIATGGVRALVRCTFHNAYHYDDCGIGLRFNNGSTNPTSVTGRTQVGSGAIMVAHDVAVPADTTSIDILAEFWRDDGSYNDGAIQKISVLLYEPTP